MTSPTVRIILAIALLFPSVARSQLDAGKASGERLTKPRFLGIPIVSYNRKIEVIFGAIAGLYYPVDASDTVSPPSFTGAAGMYSTNGTGALLAFGRMFFLEDMLRLKFGGGVGKANFQYFNEELGVDGAFVDYTTDAAFLVVTPLARVAHNVYVGPDYTLVEVSTAIEGGSPLDEQRRYSSLGIAGEYDTRPSKTYPMDGLYLTARLRRYADWLGSASEYTKAKVELNRYVEVDSGSVLALRGSVQAALGAVPFEAQSVVGNGKDIRGYSEGRYRGDQVYATQAEYRWNFAPPFGAVGFLGFALATSSGDPVTFSDVLPGVGAGFRYMMIPEIHANVGIDVAVGRNDWGLYFRIAEAF
jgi:outer membrane protein assembly factor BamA